MVDNNYEGELFITEIEDEDGVTRRFVEDIAIPYNGKNYAVLVEVVDEESASDEEPLIWIARIEEEGEDVYYESPSDEETDAVIERYEQILDEEEQEEN